MLEVRQLSVAYGQHPALQDVSLNVNAGEIVVILGANGAGKSTLLRAAAGVCEGHVDGDLLLDGAPLGGLGPDQIVERGVALVPEGRGIFGDLTVRENLILGAYARRARRDEATNLDRVMKLFPKLRERQGQIARTMSGGEQQMVAIGRAMMSAPQILMLDEPSLGLSPLLCKELFQNLRSVKALGIGVLLVEQNAKQSLAIADRGYLLENTRITHEDTAARLATDPAVQAAYLGAGSKPATTKTAAAKPVPPPDPAPAPKTVVAETASPPRVSADARAGLDIEDMVQKAAKQSAVRPVPTAPEVPADHLSAVLRDIEQAAAAARKRPGAVRKPRDTQSGRTGPAPRAVEKPPVIEIYRRPRVQVFRRSGGDFERDNDA